MMADSKRQSISKVATPKVGAGKDMPDVGDSLFKAIGGRVKVSVAPTNVTYDGYLFTADPITNMIIINTRPASSSASADYWKQPADLHIIPVCHITSFTLVDLGPRGENAGPGFAGSLPAIAPLDLKAIDAREKATIKKLKEEEARVKAGVTPEGKELFDALSRTLPCRWHETSIIVSDAVIIKPPYSINDCQAPKDKQGALTHVKKIMTALQERKRPAQAQNNASRPTVATPIAPRKGG